MPCTDTHVGVEFIEELLANEEAGTTHIMRKAKTQLVLAVIWLVTFAGITAASFDLLMSEDPAKAQYQFIPVLAIVGAGGASRWWPSRSCAILVCVYVCMCVWYVCVCVSMCVCTCGCVHVYMCSQNDLSL